uniref:helix-hairpin-helix domain-containing protein n=1 Tax=uncultured Desulfovibrio sp. TaxID=167968 RepID=UPI00263A6307
SGELLRLPGVGPATARLLWDHFGSVEAMAGAGEEELRALPGVGRARAAALREKLRRLTGAGGA